MIELDNYIQNLAENLLDDPHLFIVEVAVSLKRKPGKILVVLDGDGAVTIEDCAILSRKLSDVLDTTELNIDNYALEVTTPGLDQPLKLKRQYKKNIGRTLKVKQIGETKLDQGKLISVSETEIVLEVHPEKSKQKPTQKIIPFSSIDKTFVTISFK